jgi:dipeptidyl aminopeptidase/acylaminoacyl peptidase
VSAPDRIPFDRYAAVRRIGQAAYAPDGRRFAYVAPTSGRNQVWLQPTGGGFPTQASELEGRRVVGFTWVPEGDAIVFLADKDGDEMFQVFVLPIEGGRPGWPRQLTDAPQVQHQLGEALPGHRVLITANDREPTEMDAQILDLESGERTRLTHAGQMYAASASPDGRHALIVEVRGNMDQDLHVADLATGELRHVTPHEGEAQFWPGPWARDGRGVYLRSDLDREYVGLGFYDLERDAWRFLDTPDRDVEEVQLSRDGRTLVTAENDGGATRLRVLDPTDGRRLPDPQLPFGVVDHLALHPFERTALVTLQTPAHAPNLFELDLHGGRLQAREQSMLGGLDPERMPTPELVHVPGEEVDIPAWLYRPRGEGPFPVLLSIHGGPETQEQPTYAYNGLYAYLHERGVAVVAPNIRGSTGYGKRWQKAIHRDWGGVDLRDLTAVADWLASLPWVDASRIGVFGGSYGGFATLMAVTRLPERWSVAVDVVGPSNLVTFAKSVPPHWRPLMAALVGDPDDPQDRAMLEERSPIRYVGNVRVPMLIFQGANDPRVVQAESDQMVEALRARGLEVEYVVDEKSGHGPADRETALTWYRTIAEYLAAHLVPGEASTR